MAVAPGPRKPGLQVLRAIYHPARLVIAKNRNRFLGDTAGTLLGQALTERTPPPTDSRGYRNKNRKNADEI